MSVEVAWEVYGQGKVEVDSFETEGMTDEEIKGYIRDDVNLEISRTGKLFHTPVPRR